MRIASVSDVHFNFGHYKESNLQLLDRINKSNADVLIIAGDFSAGDFDKNYTPWLSRMSFKGPKLAVPGNHDMWDSGITTTKRYQDFCKYMQSQGWHVLDEGPFISDGVGFVGNMGWYDYSFFPKADAKRDQQARDISGIIGETVSSWNDLKRFLPTKTLPHICNWNDVNYTDWKRPDAAISDYFARQLSSDISKIEKQCDAIVAVTHHLPFEELVKRTYDVEFDFCNAFTGSYRLGEEMRKNEKVTVAICGHSHNPQHKKISNIDAYEVSMHDPVPQLTEIEIKR